MLEFLQNQAQNSFHAGIKKKIVNAIQSKAQYILLIYFLFEPVVQSSICNSWNRLQASLDRDKKWGAGIQN